ncbi:MAG: UDP-N-acetylmuramate--L-alanine ligase [Bacteroidales bacterium]|nr:UDP-N-acetylmuramate--L-alanine ligase [Bacteroidales bacterium]
MHYKNVYFIGIGGIGMSAIARYYIQRGLFVAGYDKTPTPLTQELEREGAHIHYEDDVHQIPDVCRDEASTFVVYTPAIPSGHSELQYFLSRHFDIQKRAQVLGTLTHAHKGLCVAGTHGKTTTSSMTAHLLHQSHVGCNAFLGGITKNYGTNYILSPESDYVVIEADEFDRSFHWLAPYATVITATDPDHLDIYGTEEAYLESFRHYTELIRKGGYLIIHEGLKMQAHVQDGVTTYTYSREHGDFHAEHLRIGGGEIVFDLVSPIEPVRDVHLGVPVGVNIENGIAAMALAQLAGVTADEIRAGMASFSGVDRRFDFHVKNARKVYLSDYAHHPEEIRQSILSIREVFPGKRIVGIFQPHLYTRTRDFYPDFADALSQLDEVILTEIYPARELPIEGITSQIILDNLRPGVPGRLINKADVLEVVRNLQFDVLVTLGAGDLDNYADEIARIVEQRSLEE